MAQSCTPTACSPRLVWLMSFQQGGRIEQQHVSGVADLSDNQLSRSKRRRRAWTPSNDQINDELRRAGCLSNDTAGSPNSNASERRKLEGVALVMPGKSWDGCLTPWSLGAAIQRRYWANARDAFAVNILAAWRLQPPHIIERVISQARASKGTVFESPIQFRPSHMVFKPSSPNALALASMTACPSGGERQQQHWSLEAACAACGLSVQQGDDGGSSSIPIRSVGHQEGQGWI